MTLYVIKKIPGERKIASFEKKRRRSFSRHKTLIFFIA